MKKIMLLLGLACVQSAMGHQGCESAQLQSKENQENSQDMSLEEILKNPEEIKNISLERIAKLHFQSVTPEYFLELSKESIMALLERLEFLAKFSQKQWDHLIANIIKLLNFETYDDLWQRLELNINFIVTKTDFFNRLHAADIQKVSPLIFKKMLPEVFKKLSPEKIGQLQAHQLAVLTQEQYNALDQEQVQAINVKQLSKALKYRLPQKFEMSFVEKLSSDQIRNLLAHHIGFRFKNWNTMFKDNFTPEALQYIQDRKSQDDARAILKTFDGITLSELELYRLKKATKRLSQEARISIESEFKDKQDRLKATLLAQFKKISTVAPAKLAQRVLWTKASNTILNKMPVGYQKIQIALGLKTKEQAVKLNEIFNHIKNGATHVISPETVRSLKLSSQDKEYMMQRVKDFNEVFKIGVKLDPKIKERKRKI